MTARPSATRNAIVDAARRSLATDGAMSVEALARAAGVSKATFYRHFRSRVDLLEALELEPDPGTRERILGAAAELIDRDGLARLSMDELAVAAGVSRASVYRLFPGKPALFEAVILAYSPFKRIVERLGEISDMSLDVVLPELYQLAAQYAGPRVGILRSIFFEVTSGSPDALEGGGRPIQEIVRALGGYLERQMDAGRLRRMHPTLAAQTLIGPMLFHLFTRPYIGRIGGLDMPLEEAAAEMARTLLAGFEPAGASDQRDPRIEHPVEYQPHETTP